MTVEVKALDRTGREPPSAPTQWCARPSSPSVTSDPAIRLIRFMPDALVRRATTSIRSKELAK